MPAGSHPHCFPSAGTSASSLPGPGPGHPQRYDAMIMSGLCGAGLTSTGGASAKDARLSTSPSHVSQASGMGSGTGPAPPPRGVGDMFKAALAGNLSTDSALTTNPSAGARPLSTGGLPMIR